MHSTRKRKKSRRKHIQKKRQPTRRLRRRRSRKRARARGRKRRKFLTLIGVFENEPTQRGRLLNEKIRKEGAQRMDIVSRGRKKLKTLKHNLARLEGRTRSVPQMRVPAGYDRGLVRRRRRRHRQRHTRALRHKLKKDIEEEEKHLERMTGEDIYTPTDYNSPVQEIDTDRVLAEVLLAAQEGGPEYTDRATVDDLFLKNE